MEINIVILNFNGKDLLAECLPSILIAAKNSTHNCTVTVLDNKSTDDSVAFVKENFPDVTIYAAKENKVLCSFNELAATLDTEILILLNSDIKLDKNFVDPLVKIFGVYPDAFMAAPQCWTFDRAQFEGMLTKIKMKFGFFQAFSRYPGYAKDIDTPGYTSSAGSVAAFRRDRFLELEGYDDLYLPGRLEDTDLCFRGWKRGYKAYYVPESLAYHKGMASFKKDFGYKKSLVLSYRNTFLFIWKNITDTQMLCEHIFFLPLWILFSLLKLNFSFILGFMQALPRLPQALIRRGKERTYFKESDKELFDLLGWKKYR
jgi:N-acetylglucosaminyl-diphospho-decaprenol L-rhamnosyltransferase